MVVREILADLRARHLKNRHRRDRTAIGVDSAIFLADVLDDHEQQGPVTVVDLGSGFSTWVTRWWCHTHNGIPVTTDQQTKWLITTQNECRAQGWCDWDFYLHDAQVREVLKPWTESADVVFLDTGPGHGRIHELPVVFDLLKSTGTVVVDDWHFPHVSEVLTPVFADLGFNVKGCPWVADEFGRFVGFATRDAKRMARLSERGRE